MTYPALPHGANFWRTSGAPEENLSAQGHAASRTDRPAKATATTVAREKICPRKREATFSKDRLNRRRVLAKLATSGAETDSVHSL